MTMNKTRTSSYVFTADVNSVEDMQRIDLVKKAVKSINDSARLSHRWAVRRAEARGEPIPKKPKIHRVRLMGRGPRKSSHAHNVANGGYRVWSEYNSYLPQRYATHFDIYIHEVYQYE
jgi:hypothetical protein